MVTKFTIKRQLYKSSALLSTARARCGNLTPAIAIPVLLKDIYDYTIRVVTDNNKNTMRVLSKGWCVILSFICLVFASDALHASELLPEGDYRIRDSWNEQYLSSTALNANAYVGVSERVLEWFSMQWQVEQVEQDVFRIKNVWSGNYLNTTNNSPWSESLVSTPLRQDWWSMQWIAEDAGNGKVWLKNRWTGLYLTSRESRWQALKQADLNPKWNSQKWHFERIERLASSACRITSEDGYFTEKVIYETQAKRDWYTDTWATPITSADNQTFYVYVDPTLNPKIGHIKNGVINEFSLDASYMVTDDGHNEFSIGVDKEGYIHVAGDMHNDEFRYWRSDKPYDVSSFTPYFGDIEGFGFSYYYFRVDQNNELYLAARVQALDTYFQKGGRGVGIYQYDSTKRKWTARGELADHPNARYPVVGWALSGQNGGSYQMYKSDLRFDLNNRMHLSVTVNADDSANRHNYAVYAYSDDGGENFQRLNGAKLSNPIRLTDKKLGPDIIAGYKDADMGEHASLFLDDRASVGVYYSIADATYLRFQRRRDSEAYWSEPIQIRSANCERCLPIYDRFNNVHHFIDDYSVYSFSRYTGAKIKKTLNSRIKRWDLRGLRDEQRFQGVEWDSSTGRWRIIRYENAPKAQCPN